MNRKISLGMAVTIVMEKVTVMARITMVTAMPTEILRFMLAPPC